MKTVRLTFMMRPPKALERPACRTGSAPLNDATWPLRSPEDGS